MEVINVIIAPHGAYCDGDRGYWLKGQNIALNAEAYKVEDNKLFDIFGLKIDSNVEYLENEYIFDMLGNEYETIEEYLQLNYGLQELDLETWIIVSFEDDTLSDAS